MKKLFFLLPVVVLVMVGCRNTDLEPYSNLISESDFSAVIENFESHTKTALGPDRIVIWSENDQIAIFQGSTLSDKFQIKESSVGNSNGVFTYVSNEGEENGDFNAGNEVVLETNIAIYPYQENLTCLPVYDDSELVSYIISNVTIPANQIYAENSFSSGVFPMVAVTEGERDHNLKFKNLFGVLKLQLFGERVIKSITVTGKSDEILAGAATIIAYPDGSIPKVELDMGGAKSVTLDCGSGVQINEDEPTVFMIALPPTPFKGGFDIEVRDNEDEVVTFSTISPNPIERSVILCMPEVDTDELEDDGIKNLSLPTPANSYIVSEAGTFKFKTVKGNTDTLVGKVAQVEVLWESFGTDQAPNPGDLIQSVSYQKRYITFTTSAEFKEGNAVIAAKDAGGNILWSWHIWMTDQPQEQVYFNDAGTMMDRNLGETSATPGYLGTHGLMYQWGRKDPFLGSSSFINNVVALSTSVNWSSVSDENNICSLAYSIANPMTFIGRVSWGLDPSVACWNTSVNPKSMYDPCPAGWRVPDGYSPPLYGVWNQAAGNIDKGIQGIEDDTKPGVNFGGILGSSTVIWYPFCGILGYGSGQMIYVSEYGDLWATRQGGHVSMEVGTWYLHPFQGTPANGKSVRCVKE